MASGVAFREDYTDRTSDIATLGRATLGQEPGGGVAAVTRFNTRNAEPGQLFSYASSESMVLGLVLARATRRSVSDYASEKLWQPLGAEADATWSIDATGQEITYAYFNAVLRDWGRLGLMLANDGRWAGKSIVPREWLLESTTPYVGLSGPRGREEVLVTKNRAGLPEPPVWLSCVAAVRTGPAVFAARPSGAVRLRGSGIEAGAGANGGARSWLPGRGVVCPLGRATVAVALGRRPQRESPCGGGAWMAGGRAHTVRGVQVTYAPEASRKYLGACGNAQTACTPFQARETALSNCGTSIA